MSLLLSGLPPWISYATACPEHEGDTAKASFVVMTDGEGDAKAPCIVKTIAMAPDHAGAKGQLQYIVTSSGDAPQFVSADGEDGHAYAFVLADGNKDGRSEEEIVWVGSPKDAEKRAWLGVSIGKVPASLASQLDIEGQGVLVLNVVADSPADEAGFKPHDIILAIDGEEVEGKTGRAISLIKSNTPGDELEVVILRDGREQELTVELGSRADAHVMNFAFKFGDGPAAELQEKVRTRARIMKRGEGGEWVIKDLGDIKSIKNLPNNIKMFMPMSGTHSTQIFVSGNEKKIKTIVEQDGGTITITQEGDGPITVTRTDEDGRETEEEYASADQLADDDEEAYELWEKIGDNIVVHLDLDAIEIPDFELPDLDFSTIELPEFNFEFDTEEFEKNAEEWREHMEEFGEAYGEKMRAFGEEYGQEWKEWAEEFGTQFEGLEDGEVPDNIKFPSMPMFLGHGNKPFPGLMHMRHRMGKAQHTFDVDSDGSIKVRIRKGGSELVQTFDDVDDLADRNPKLFKKYERMMGLENE
jgi:hypothetical protein